MHQAREHINALFKKADIQINGDRPWDIKIHNNRFFERLIRQGSIGLGESYMDKWWDAEALEQFFYRVLRAGLDREAYGTLASLGIWIKSFLKNPQSPARAFQVGEHHYDIGNDLYEMMLDKRMTYTCGYWKGAKTIDEAQQNKLEMVCRALQLKKGDRVLDVGCGWGSFCRYAAEKYGAELVGITVSEKQAELARKRCEGLPVEIRLQDYRKVNGQFDHVISLGMFEHVGYKNYRTYMKVVKKCLKKNGTFVLDTIGGNYSVHHTDPWIEKYIFPNSMIPSVRQIGLAIEDLFVMEDWSNFGIDYYKTLMAWHQRVEEHRNKMQETYTNRFFRMWKYYLLCSAGSFLARKNHQWQIVLTPSGRSGGFERPVMPLIDR